MIGLVYRLAYNGDIAAGRLAVFQGASEVPISELIRAERATRKNSQLDAAQRLRCSSVTYSLNMRPPRALPAAHFERNDVIIIYETVH